MYLNKCPIGVFDSGIGGLTVLKRLVQDYPNENFIYIADYEYNPYGTKKREEIESRVIKIGKYLEEQQCKVIIIACNTASIYAEKLQKVVKIPVISVIEPTVNLALSMTKNNRIGLLATDMTVNSNYYQNLIKNESAYVKAISASPFVEIIESNTVDSNETDKIVYSIIKPLLSEKIDTLIYGCTHFELIHKPVYKYLKDINYITSGIPVSKHLKSVLSVQLNEQKSKGSINIYSTSKIDDNLVNKIEIFNLKYDKIESIRGKIK